jgi:hypothetical protein
MEINPAQWDQESRNSMDAYLDAVEAVWLEQKTPRSERILILGELESQIHAVIASRLEAPLALNWNRRFMPRKPRSPFQAPPSWELQKNVIHVSNRRLG